MRKGTLNVCVLKGDRLNGDDDCEEVNAPVGSLLSTTVSGHLATREFRHQLLALHTVVEVN